MLNNKCYVFVYHNITIYSYEVFPNTSYKNIHTIYYYLYTYIFYIQMHIYIYVGIDKKKILYYT